MADWRIIGVKFILIDFFSLLDAHQGILIVLGWFAVFWFGLRQSRRQLRDEAKMKVYEELCTLKKELDKASINLSTSLMEPGSTFIMMRATLSASLSEKFQNAWNHWHEYCNKISSDHGKFVDAYLAFWNHIEMWLSLMPDLELAKKNLFREINNISKSIYNHQSFLSDLSGRVNEWEKWNQEEIKSKAKTLWVEFSYIASCYPEDFMGLVHDELVFRIVGTKRKLRHPQTLHPLKYKILTKRGIIEKDWIGQEFLDKDIV